MNDALNIVKDWAIVTVPRTGSHYLQERLFVHTGHVVLKYHEPKPQTWGYAIGGLLNNNARFWSGLEIGQLKMITIARDPKDLLISDITMAIKQKHRNFEDISLLQIKDIQDRANQYCDHYTKLSSQSKIIVDYDQLVSYPFETTCHIANLLNIKIITEKYKTKLKDYKNGYMVSSKNASGYDVIKEAVDQVDLFKFYEAYDKIKSKCISL
jgi:hypothetical protein